MNSNEWDRDAKVRAITGYLSSGDIPSPITGHEIGQWKQLFEQLGEKNFPTTTSRLNLWRDGVSPPKLDFQIVFSNSGKPTILFSQIPPSEEDIAIVAKLAPIEVALYFALKEMSVSIGLCTRSDLAWTLWPPDKKILPKAQTINVHITRANKNMAEFGIKIAHLNGRGFTLRRSAKV